MNKTLNQRIYETPLDVKKAIYDSGYEDGINSGKLCAAQQILGELEETFIAKRYEYKQKQKQAQEASRAVEYPEAASYWLGRAFTCDDVLRLLTELRRKYEVQ